MDLRLYCGFLSFLLFIDIAFSVEPLLNTDADFRYKRRPCVDIYGKPQMCTPSFSSAAYNRKINATNTCGLVERQKWCIELSHSTQKYRCLFCDKSVYREEHSPNYMVDADTKNWWQSETLAANKMIHYRESINLTLNLGTQFQVAYIYLKFRSPRPAAMIIHRKFNDSSVWEPWQYFASNCRTYFKMPSDLSTLRVVNEVTCTEKYSQHILNYYDGEVVFRTLENRQNVFGNYMDNSALQKWTTASQIRIELKKMFTFGDEKNAETETLLTYFYAITTLAVGGRCLCHGHGNDCQESSGIGREPKMYCICHPSHHTMGQNCEECAPGYQDLPWQPGTPTNANACQKCNCNGNSNNCFFNMTLFLESGLTSGGQCVNCMNNTEGPHCEKCKPYHAQDANLPNVCRPCECNPVGSAKLQCDATGQCLCKPGVTGPKCDRCAPDHFGFSAAGCRPCQCLLAGSNNNTARCDPTTGQCSCKRNVIGDKCDRCLNGYFGLYLEDPLGCQPCFCYAHTSDCKAANNYLENNITSDFTTGVDEWVYKDSDSLFSNLPHWSVNPPYITLPITAKWQENYFLIAPKKYLGDQRLSYNQFIELLISFEPAPGGSATDLLQSQLDDVQLISGLGISVSVPFVLSVPTPDTGKLGTPQLYRFRLNEESGNWRSRMTNQLFYAMLSDIVAFKIRLTNLKGTLRLHKVTLNSAKEIPQNQVPSPSSPLSELMVKTVERCTCPPGYSGDSCDGCAVGFRREIPGGGPFVRCVPCKCNGNADICEPDTGMCRCGNNTAGMECDRCADGYYGDAVNGECKKCDCPNNGKCTSYKVAGKERVVCTECPEHQIGMRCGFCEDGYYGDPLNGKPCTRCQCNGNVDFNAIGNCNSTTGECLRCVYNTWSSHCEKCLPSFYGNALAKPANCRPCMCDPFGTARDAQGRLACDQTTGKCPCKINVVGDKCDQCRPGYFNISSGLGCTQCSCELLGSKNTSCSQKTGQCPCKPGVGGVQCDKCAPNHFNMTFVGCQPCLCNPVGSVSLQCNSMGKCPCKPHVVGDKCKECALNRQDIAKGCPECPPCYGLLNDRVKRLQIHLNNLRDLLAGGGPTPPPTYDTAELRRQLLVLNTSIVNLYIIATGEGPAGDVGLQELIMKLDGLLILINGTGDTYYNQVTNFKMKCDISNTGVDLFKLINQVTELDRLLDTQGQRVLKQLEDMASRSGTQNLEMADLATRAATVANQFEADAGVIEKNVVDAQKNLDSAIEILAMIPSIMGQSKMNLSLSNLLVDKLIIFAKQARKDSMTVQSSIDALQTQATKLIPKIAALSKPNLLPSIQAISMKFKDIGDLSKALIADMEKLNASLGTGNLNQLLLHIRNELMAQTFIADAVRAAMTNLNNLLNRTVVAQGLFDDALARAYDNLKKLQGGKEAFDAEVAKWRTLANQAKQNIPAIESSVGAVEKKVDEIGESMRQHTRDILAEMDKAQVVTGKAINQSSEMERFMNETYKLGNKTVEEEKRMESIRADAVSLQDNLTRIGAEVEGYQRTANEVDAASTRQEGAANATRTKADDLLAKLLALTKEMKANGTYAEQALLSYRKELDALRDAMAASGVEKQLAEINARNDQLKRDVEEMYREYANYEAERSNLKQISEFMIDSKVYGCWKFGGLIEGGAG